MNPSRSKRKSRNSSLAPELLESRDLMTGGVGSTFAIIPATVTTAGGRTSVSFQLNPTYFTDPGNKPFLLGVDVAAGTSSTANPVVTSVTSPTGKGLSVSHALFDTAVKRSGAASASKFSTAALVTIPGLPAKNAKSFTYTVNVTATSKTSGQVLVGFYIPGDASGTGLVNQASLNAIKFGLNTTATDTTGKYAFDADVNRDGQINALDVALATKDLGVGTTVSPVISANVTPSQMTDATKRITNLSTVTITGAATPNSTITYSEVGVSPITVVADKTGAYAINIPLLTGVNTYSVTTSDAFGQKITGSINSITYSPNVVIPTTT